MTSINELFRYPAGDGWIVFSGGADAGSVIRAQTLRRVNAEGGVAYVGLGGASGDDVLDDLEDLGAPTGFHVNIVQEDDETIRRQIQEASLVVIDSSAALREMLSALRGAADEGMRAAYERGAVIFAEGQTAAVLGQHVLTAEGEILEGLGWLQDSMVLALDTTPRTLTEFDAVRAVLEAHPHAFAIGITIGSALAVGAGGAIETWGARQISIALGRDYDKT